MKPDPPPADVLPSQDVADLPPKRKWFGYAAVAASLVITYALWLGAMGAADEWYDNPWNYPAKVGSHGTLILMCWAFILATRFRWVERLFGGLDKVYKAHRHIGESAFFLIFLHPVFLAVAHADSVSAFFQYLWFSGNWVRNTGLIALAIFILLVVLSIYSKLAYHLWKRSHDFFGALLVLIVLHAVLANGEIMRYPVLMVWHGTWVVLALAAYAYIRVFYRRFGPLYDYTVESVADIGDAITEIRLKPNRRALRPAPGQFIYVSFDADAVNREPHPFSISSSPEAPHLRLSIKQLGDWTQDVTQIKPGKSGRVWGPYGHFTKLALAEPHMPLVMIGGGIGITPFLSLVASKAFAGRGGKSTLVYAVANRSSAVYLEELRTRAEALPHFTLIEHYSDEAGYVDRAYLESVVAQPFLDCLFMVCGPPPLMAGLRTLLADAGVTARQIIMEDFEIR
ncbi:MAG: ferric reductase-like transmembrane domain-containing protein [Verrucomicrobia bacterium]|nr:ferric reductase-like transmembrane domain-containing protein [Verrucomicrobiota bacterium]